MIARGPRHRNSPESAVAILRARGYETDLADTVERGVRLFHRSLDGQTVVLKPNLVEHDPHGVINTHPAVIAAAIDAFRRLGARRIVVAEGPGHRRDTEYVLRSSGLLEVLRERRVPYVDLNVDAIRRVKIATGFTKLGYLYLPETVLGADLLVSMPKLKTHHWAGVTLSMKNFFGVIPGGVYGWPKNVLHHAGIDKSILDIASTLPVPQFAIVDAIVGMEGDGPIHGQARDVGALVFGDDLVAVDATATRLMGLVPEKVAHLARAGFLGNVDSGRIAQAAEPLDELRQAFDVVPRFQRLRGG
jgi:uncharacterized protein (DUF362 family)